MGGRNDRSQDLKVFVCRCRCEKMATVAWNHPPPPWPTVNLIGLARRQKKMAHYWLAFDRRVSVRVTVRVCVCVQTSVLKAAVFANALPLRARHPRVGRARARPGGRGIKASPPIGASRLCVRTLKWVNKNRNKESN